MLTDELKSKLIAELSSPVYAGLSESQAYGLLNDPQVVTTTSQQPKALTVESVLAALSAGSVAKLLPLPCLLDVRDKIQAQDRQGVGLWANVFAMGGAIAAQEVAGVMSVLTATEDVTTSETVPPRISTEFGGVNGMPNRLKPEDFAELWKQVNHG